MSPARPPAGPWARGVLAALAGGRGGSGGGEVVDVAIGRAEVLVSSCLVAFAVERVPRATWRSMVRYARGMGPLEEAVAGRLQSPHLDHLLAEDWGESLVPRAGRIRRTCSCDGGSECRHVPAAAAAFAAAVDADPRVFLRWRGCVDEDAPDDPDPWSGTELPAASLPRRLPPGAVLKRLGPSGIDVGGVDLATLLGPAYDAFAGR